jgi:uncharacterized protein YgbK (DUF1537 family)
LPEGDADVKVIATDSRQAGREESRKIHRCLAESLKLAGVEEIFKKTDSVLRGYVVDELTEIMDVFGFEKVILQPSNPMSGRCIKNGLYLINGIPLNLTPFSADPDFPAKSASVKDLLLPRSVERKISIHTKSSSFDDSGIYVTDCLSGADMNRLLSEPVRNGLYAGSAAFFGAYLKVKKGLHMKRKFVKFNPLEGRFLMVCGSTHDQSLDFIRRASKKEIAISVLPETLMKENIDDNELIGWALKQAEIWNDSGQMIISFSSKFVNFKDCSNILKKRMSRIVHEILDKCPVVELLIEGGATAFSILGEQEWTLLNPVKELSPGVVRMQVVTNPGFYLTMKPGSYLWPDYFLN